MSTRLIPAPSRARRRLEARRRRPVAVLLSRFPLVTETFILREVTELEAQGQPVILVPLIREQPPVVHPQATPWMPRAWFTPWLSREIVAANLRFLRRAPRTYTRVVLRILTGAAGSPGVLVRSLALFPKAVYLAERIEGAGVRHAHAHFATHPATVAWIVSELTGIGFSFTAHAHDIFVDRALLREKIAGAAFVRVISEFNREFLSARYPKESAGKLRVLRLGVRWRGYARSRAAAEEHLRARHAPVPASLPTLLCVAGLKPYKGVSVLLEACELLRERGVSLRCDIVGDGPLRTRLEREIVDRRLESVVRLLGAEPEEDVRQRMATCAAFVLPSVVARDGQMEGLPVALMEALAARVPVVASRLSGIPELVIHERTGLLVEPGNAASLAHAIERLLKHSILARRLAKAGQERVRTDFDLHGSVSSLIRELDEHNPELETDLNRLLGEVVPEQLQRGLTLRRRHDRRDSLILELEATNDAAPSLVLKLHQSREGESLPASERARREFALLSGFDAEHVPGWPSCSVPRPLWLDEAHAAVLMERCRGESLERLIHAARRTQDPRRSAAVLEAVRGAGFWLGGFHRQKSLGGQPVRALWRIVDANRRNLATCGELFLRRSEVRSVEERLRSLQDEIAINGLRLVGRHGDFWPGNVFVADDSIEVIDFEGFGPGLPEEDAGDFLTHISLFYAYPAVADLGDLARDAFLTGYTAAGRLQPALLELARTSAALRVLAHSVSRPGFLDGGVAAWFRMREVRRAIFGGAKR